MSQELYEMLHERSRISVIGWPVVLAGSLVFHGLLVGLILYSSDKAVPTEVTKTTWVTLPAMGSTGPAGGSSPMEEGKQGERQRRVEEVAPVSHEKPGAVTPNAFGTKPTPAVKGTNTDENSLGKAPVAAKGKNPAANPTVGAAGSGNGNSVGNGSTGIPGLKASSGVSGGSGFISELDQNSFPFLVYLQQIQNRITGNWSRFTSAQGRVQIYFRIKRDGTLEGIRVENSSGNGNLDESARLAVMRSDPLPPMPEGFDGQTLGVHFFFSYTP